MRPGLLLLTGLFAGGCTWPARPVPAPMPTPGPPAPAGTPAAAPVLMGAASDTTPSAATGVDYVRSREIIVPVSGPGVRITNTFNAPRDGGRRLHAAIDILAPRGTPVLSADDGRVLRMSNNPLGGISMYATDAEGQLVYYYAHLARYHHSMSPGRTLAKGDTIGYVGTTGNAPANIPHLHFQVMHMPRSGRYWDGVPIDVYPLLVEARP